MSPRQAGHRNGVWGDPFLPSLQFSPLNTESSHSHLLPSYCCQESAVYTLGPCHIHRRPSMATTGSRKVTSCSRFLSVVIKHCDSKQLRKREGLSAYISRSQSTSEGSQGRSHGGMLPSGSLSGSVTGSCPASFLVRLTTTYGWCSPQWAGPSCIINS